MFGLKLSNFHPREVVYRVSETKLHVGENLNYLIQRFKGLNALHVLYLSLVGLCQIFYFAIFPGTIQRRNIKQCKSSRWNVRFTSNNSVMKSSLKYQLGQMIANVPMYPICQNYYHIIWQSPINFSNNLFHCIIVLYCIVLYCIVLYKRNMSVWRVIFYASVPYVFTCTKYIYWVLIVIPKHYLKEFLKQVLVNPFSAGNNFHRSQILTSNVDPALKEEKYL